MPTTPSTIGLADRDGFLSARTASAVPACPNCGRPATRRRPGCCPPAKRVAGPSTGTGGLTDLQRLAQQQEFRVHDPVCLSLGMPSAPSSSAFQRVASGRRYFLHSCSASAVVDGRAIAPPTIISTGASRSASASASLPDRSTLRDHTPIAPLVASITPLIAMRTLMRTCARSSSVSPRLVLAALPFASAS